MSFISYYLCTKRHELRFAIHFSFFLFHDFVYKFMHAYISFIIPGLPGFTSVNTCTYLTSGFQEWHEQ